ncbi:MAG: OB-fold domain-containing protein [Syntrophorhabdales bacterium]
MIGITSVGAYIPTYRLSGEEIGRMWRARGTGEKAVAGYDEDTVTMSVAAALECMKGAVSPAGLFCATTTAPYKEKQIASIVAAACDLDKTCRTADFTNSLRAGTSALLSALDAVKAGASSALVTASDCRVGAPKGRFEPILGDSACALMIGSNDVLAEIEGTYSIFNEFTDLWRTEHDTFPQAGEARFIEEMGYFPAMKEVVAGLMKTYSRTPSDFSKIVFYAPDMRQHASMAKALGFENVQDPLYGTIGNTGTPATLIMLISALEEAQPGDRILFASYGDGCDAFIFRVVKPISGLTMKERLARKVNIDYGTYLLWRDLLPVEPSSLPERSEPSLATRWRQRKTVSSLYGFKCKKCGTPQLHPLGQIVRICVSCQSKDDFESYKFSDKTGRLFTYAVDQLQPTKNPPGLNGIVDFDGGGRMICELTDYDIKKAQVGMPVEMTFRKLSQGKGIVNYFWKAKPME